MSASPVVPVLFMDTSWGGIAIGLTPTDDRIAAEVEAAFLVVAAPEEVVIFRATVLMLAADSVEHALECLAAGLPVHSVDCDCEGLDQTPLVIED